jgi:Arc/MetJ-type ribon-helix-helix transcriptional regulator
MNREIHKPELLQRVNAHIRTGQFHDTDEVIEKTLDALDEKTSGPASAAECRRATDPKSRIELFEPVRGLLTDEEVDRLFSRNKSASRPVDLG